MQCETACSVALPHTTPRPRRGGGTRPVPHLAASIPTCPPPGRASATPAPARPPRTSRPQACATMSSSDGTVPDSDPEDGVQDEGARGMAGRWGRWGAAGGLARVPRSRTCGKCAGPLCLPMRCLVHAPRPPHDARRHAVSLDQSWGRPVRRWRVHAAHRHRRRRRPARHAGGRPRPARSQCGRPGGRTPGHLPPPPAAGPVRGGRGGHAARVVQVAPPDRAQRVAGKGGGGCQWAVERGWWRRPHCGGGGQVWSVVGRAPRRPPMPAPQPVVPEGAQTQAAEAPPLCAVGLQLAHAHPQEARQPARRVGRGPGGECDAGWGARWAEAQARRRVAPNNPFSRHPSLRPCRTTPVLPPASLLPCGRPPPTARPAPWTLTRC